jgi:hypothetical protein
LYDPAHCASPLIARGGQKMGSDDVHCYDASRDHEDGAKLPGIARNANRFRTIPSDDISPR